ncbi:MAG: histidine kinase [Rhodothermales bacterium]
MPSRASSIALRAFVVLVPLVSLLMLGRLVADWMEIARVTGEAPSASAPRGFDWVQWQDRDGEIVAVYVYPGGTAYAAGLREDAVLYQWEFQQFFSAEDVKRAVEGVVPGDVLVYDVAQYGQLQSFEIGITRYPTFLYPLSGMLWQLSLWGFAVVAFLHLLGLIIVAPLVWRSPRARRSFALFAAASLWVFGNLVRLLSLTLLGPPMDGAYATFFQALTLVALGGWILFPALLLRTVLADLGRLRPFPFVAAIFLPALVLGGAVGVAVFAGSIGPLTLDALIAPILFYVCCYVAAATGLTLAVRVPAVTPEGDAVPASTAWSRAGSAAVFAIAALGALSVYGIVPVPGAVSDATVGGLIVLIQLLSLAPVGLASVATLRHGRADTVVTRALAYVAVYGLVFFVVAGGLIVLGRALPPETTRWPRSIIAGLYVVFLLFVAERLAGPLRQRVGNLFVTDRQRARARLRDFSERMRLILDPQRLAEETVETAGDALGARSAVLFLRLPDAVPTQSGDPWTQARYRAEPPLFTEAELRRVWNAIQHQGTVWARNAELDESDLGPEDDRLLTSYGVALAVPVAGGETEPAGLLVLGRKERRRAVYNLEDVAMLRSLCGQLALAAERLALIEREKALAKESAEAQLVALRAQINPHFLFNALNTIAALIEEMPREAEGTVERLASIFRHVLRTGGHPFVPLADEVRLVDDYLAIEQVRFGDKLTVERAWDPALTDLPVPAFALQTLVENAVKHGIERKRGGGTLALSSRLLTYPASDQALAEIRVVDTGLGIPALFAGGDGVAVPADTAVPLDPPDFYGIGLRNVAARLERLYGRSDLLQLASTPESGTTARLLIPMEGVSRASS